MVVHTHTKRSSKFPFKIANMVAMHVHVGSTNREPLTPVFCLQHNVVGEEIIHGPENVIVEKFFHYSKISKFR